MTTVSTGSDATARPLMGAVNAYAPAEIAKVIEDYYGRVDTLIWVDGQGPNAKARAALDLLSKADEIGLNSADYRVDLPAIDPTADAATRETPSSPSRSG